MVSIQSAQDRYVLNSDVSCSDRHAALSNCGAAAERRTVDLSGHELRHPLSYRVT